MQKFINPHCKLGEGEISKWLIILDVSLREFQFPHTFPRVYCVPEVLERDSVRFRRRLGSFCNEHLHAYRGELVSRIEIETGTRVPWAGTVRSLDRFFESAEIRDVLDAITHIMDVLRSRSPSVAGQWRNFVSRVFSEEGTTYRLDANGAITYAVDEAYAASRRATLAGLSHPTWQEPKAEFERAFAAMDSDPPDSNTAVRAMAAALEAASKIIVGNSISRVGPAEIERNLWPLIRGRYAADAAAAASHEMLKAYSDWTNVTHQYRHGQGGSTEGHAPVDLAIVTLTVGGGILRWLIGLDLSRESK